MLHTNVKEMHDNVYFSCIVYEVNIRVLKLQNILMILCLSIYLKYTFIPLYKNVKRTKV